MARPHPALIDLATGRPVRGVADFERFVRSAIEHRMGGLVLSRVQGGEIEASHPALRALATVDLRAQAHHQRLWNSLKSVTERLGQAGFDVATFKGVTAEARWYDRPGERPCGDLDLLVNPDDVDRVDEIVRLLQPDHPLLPAVRSLVAGGHLQSIDLEAGPNVSIDLHVDLLKLGIPARGGHLIWERAMPFSLPEGGRVQVLDPEIALVHFLLHLTRDRFSCLLGFVDVLRLLEREQVDWSFVDRFLHREGLEVPVYLALDRVLETLSLPPVRHGLLRGWRARTWNRLWPAGDGLQGASGIVGYPRRQLLLPLLVRGRAREAARWWFHRVVLLPPALVDDWHGTGRGPYWWRLIWGHVRKSIVWRWRRTRHRGQEHTLPPAASILR